MDDSVEKDEPKSCWIIVSECGQWMQSIDEPVFSTGLFVLFSVILFLTMNCCELCVVGVMVCSLFLCLQFRIFNILLFACICVLWSWGWSFGGHKGLSLSWN